MNVAFKLRSGVKRRAIEQVADLAEIKIVMKPEEAHVVITDDNCRRLMRTWLKQGKHVIRFWSGSKEKNTPIEDMKESFPDHFRTFGLSEIIPLMSHLCQLAEKE